MTAFPVLFPGSFLAVSGNSIPSAWFRKTGNGSQPSPASRRTLGAGTHTRIEGRGRGRGPAHLGPAPPPRTRPGPAPAPAGPSCAPSLPGLPRAAASGSVLRCLGSGWSRAGDASAVWRSSGAEGCRAATMAEGQDLFDAIVMADDRWVAGLGRDWDPGPIGSPLARWAAPAARACCPAGAGLGAALCGAESSGHVWGRGAIDPPLLLGQWAGRHVPSCSCRPASAVRGCPKHLLGLVTAFLQGRPVRGWDRPLPSGHCPFFLFLSSRTYGSIHGRADKCVRRHPFAPWEVPRAVPRGTCEVLCA